MIKKETAIGYLLKARKTNIPKEERERLAKEGLSILNEIEPTSEAYLAARYDAATAYRLLKKYKNAIDIYMELEASILHNQNMENEEKNRRLADIDMMRGNVYQDKGDLSKARELYFKAWKLDPDDLNRTLNLHDICVKLGKKEEAKVWSDSLKKRKDFEQVSDFIEIVSEKDDE